MSKIGNACHTMADLLQKAYVLVKRDAAKEISCLRRRKSCPIYLLMESSIDIAKKMYNRSYLLSIIVH